MNIRFLIAHAAADLREIWGESRRLGWNAGRVCFRAHWENLDSLCRERFHRSRRVQCPCCGWEGHRFRALFLADSVLHDAECPRCGAHQRQRALTLWLTGPAGDAFRRGALWLHVAPERSLRELLINRLGARIVSADLMPDKLHVAGGAAFRTDLVHAAAASAVFDYVLCIHVLEHIGDDGAAVRELHRVLRPGGKAIVMVPNDLAVSEIREYGGPNPRMYGHWRDYTPRAMDRALAPFVVEALDPKALFSAEMRARHGIIDEDFIYLCTRGA